MRVKWLLGAAALVLAFAAPAASPPITGTALSGDPIVQLYREAAFCTPGPHRGRLAYFLSMADAYAQSTGAPSDRPPLIQGLGEAHMAITTNSQLAQAYFDQGLRLLHGFNHLEAARAFRAGYAEDPNCAMCYWGEAFALGPNINAPMDANDNPAAYAAARHAHARLNGVTPKERALIEAIQTRYTRQAPDSRAALDIAYADAMKAVADRYPEDDLIQTIAVEAAMDTQPWDYWQAGGTQPKGRTADMVERLERVLARNPNDSGAIHLYIHVVEASTDPWRAEQAAERLARITPAAGHLVHMPAHIYYRVGRMRDSIDANIDAVAADERYLAARNASPTYQYGYYTHNIHFVLTSAAMAGDGRTALEYADKLDAALPMEMAAQVVLAQPVKASVWFVRGQFAPPADVLAAAQPPAGVDYVTGAWRFARGLAHIRSGNAQGAREEAQAIAAMRATGNFQMMNAQGIPAQDVLETLRLVLVGRAAMLENDNATAIASLEAAVATQARIPYMEPPFVYYPVRRTLGAALLRANQPARAEIAFLQTLTESPNDAYAYWGIAEARRMRGDRRGRNAARTLFRDAHLGPDSAVRLGDL